MHKWHLAIASLICLVLWSSRAEAGFGFYNLTSKAGLDVVQSNDTRHFFNLQADIATVFTRRLMLEVASEFGRGRDLDETEIRVIGGGAFLKYLWPHESTRAFAYMGGGLGLNRVRRQRLITNAFEYDTQLALHFILVGMEKHLAKGRLRILFEVRWVIGEEEDATALRSAVGLGVNFGKP